MRNILSLFLIILTGNWCISQSAAPDGLYSTADNFIRSDAQISWTLGDIQTATLRDKGNTLIITPGFLQSKFTIVGLEQFSDYKDVEVKVFPNPFHDVLNIDLTSNQKLIIWCELFDIKGEKIYKDKLAKDQNSIQMQFTHLQNGYYILKVSSEDKKFYKTYKILYQD